MKKIITTIRAHQDKERAVNLLWFFKTGKGEYGYGDKFLGLTMPLCHKLARQFSWVELSEVEHLLASRNHEERMIGLLILVDQFKRGDEKKQKQIFELYVRSVGKAINNWDLVDVTAPKIVGAYLEARPKGLLYKFAKSPNLWKRRVAIVSTMYFIQKGNFSDTILISKLLIGDKHDLIHKAVGWMLREVGKRSLLTLREFLDVYCREMPRTMLRYAIEKLPEENRQAYLRAGKNIPSRE